VSDLVMTRLRQAREALEEARALRDSGMDAPLVQSALYQAYYYPVLALVYGGRMRDSMQSVTIGLFEQQFVRTGLISREHGDAVRKAFELKPKCSGGGLTASGDEVELLLSRAEEFIRDAESYLAT